MRNLPSGADLKIQIDRRATQRKRDEVEKRSESFGRLLKASMASVGHVEGKTQQGVEQEFGALLGVAGVTIQRYKAGYIPPDVRRVELLAEAGVRRGLLGRLWLERFLAGAHYPAHPARVLSASLFPEAAALAPRAPAQANLPAPTYARFVMRPAAYAAALEGLRSELPVTLVVSLGGMGKTSLARAVSAACLEARAEGPRFDTAVWISDKDRPGSTNLSVALREIARALDYPGLMALAFAERLREVDDLLRRLPTLLVIDNAETITDEALLAWVARLPAPSKALVTSRSALAFADEAFLVELGPMTAEEARALVADWLPRSRLRGAVRDLDQLMPLALAAGGNPKAIELALGLVQRRPRDEVLLGLANARLDLFDDLFAHAWALLDAQAQRVLLALPHFPGSASAEALAHVSTLPPPDFQRASDQLASLSLLDIERGDLLAQPRYNAHALVRAFAQARLAEAPERERLALRGRWLAWCVGLAQAVGFCWNDLDRLGLLDSEHATVQAAVRLAVELGDAEATIALVEGLRYYYNVRGIWGEEELRNNAHRAAAARRLGDPDNEALALAHHVEILSKQGRLAEAAKVMERLAALADQPFRSRLAGEGPAPGAAALSDEAAFEYGHALGLYARARGRLPEATARWRSLLAFSQRLGGQKYVVNRRWLATSLLERGLLEEAGRYFAESLEDARRIYDTRSVTGNALKLAAIDMLRGDWEAAERALEECRGVAARYRDRRRLAEAHRLAANLCLRRGDRVLAHQELSAARDLFERLGMRPEAAEAGAAAESLLR